MKRVIALFISLTLILTSCTNKVIVNEINDNNIISTASEVITMGPVEDYEITYTGLNDDFLLSQVEHTVYYETVKAINCENYVVESVKAVYISKEYIEEVMFNSQTNVYFGYTLEELNELFQGKRYVFTLGNDGQTEVKELEVVEDSLAETIMNNVVIGTGVILICVTVSIISGGVGAPAVSAIFAASAKDAAIMAVSSAAFGGLCAGIVRGIETGDMREVLDAAFLEGSEEFKWGAITGAIVGGSKETIKLNLATKNGLTMNEAALIQKESQLPLDIIANFHSMEEYSVYKEAGLNTYMVNGRIALIQNVDLNYESTYKGMKVTNLYRMQNGLAPIDPLTGTSYELHHVGQKENGVLAVLTSEQHRGEGNYKKLHAILQDSEVNHGKEWDSVRDAFWKDYAKKFTTLR